jgi:hypothetical protein
MQFKVLYRRAARESFSAGKLTQEQYDQIMLVLRHPIRRRLNKAGRVNILAEVEKYTHENMPKEGINWEAILQWLKDNWLTILKLILSLVVLLEPPPQDK